MRIFGFLLLAATLQMSQSAKILSILPIAMRSHAILYERLMNELANRGHKVTFITAFDSKDEHENMTRVIVPDGRTAVFGNVSQDMLHWRKIPFWLSILSMPYASGKLCDLTLGKPNVIALKDAEPFDLIFGEPVMDESIVAGFSYHHKAPIVALSTLMPNYWSNYWSGNIAPPSFIPDPLLAYPPHMTFSQRLVNVLLTLLAGITQRVSLYYQDLVMRRHFGDDLPYIDDILRNTSLLLVNDQFSVTFPRPKLPNTIEVAGMHVFPPKPLPKDLEEFMTNSENGVILFSLGTNVKSSSLPQETIDGILRALGRLKENVLWKFEKNMENLPKNVKIEKWLPQSDLLAHPNLKLFITHGGMLSTTEAVYRGVPIVGIPVMADQPNNMMHNENAGLGKTILLDDLSEETLYEAVTEVLSNPKYRSAAKSKSQLMHDTVLEPLEAAVWWIEYVLRHKGAPHLRSTSQDLYWFQFHQIDTIATVTIGTIAIFAFNIWVFMTILRRIFRKKYTANSIDKKVK